MSDRLSLNDVCSHIVDCEHKTAPEAVPGREYGYSIGTPNIRNGRLLLATAKRVDQLTYEGWTAREIPSRNDIILTREAPVGEAAILDGENHICLGQRTVLLRPNSKIVSPRYLHYWLLSPAAQESLHNRSEGSTVAHLNVADIRGIILASLPPLVDQGRIGNLLGALDDKIAVNDRIADTARRLARSKFDALVKERRSAECELSEVSELLTRGVTPQYTRDSNQLTVLNQKCIRDGRVSFEPARRTMRNAVPHQKILRTSDILVNSTGVGTLGRVALWSSDNLATVDSHVTIVRIDSSKADPVCAGFALLGAQHQIESLGQGSTGQTELSRARLGELRLPILTSESAGRLRLVLDALESRGNAALAESATLAQLRDTLLPKLMSGEIRVRDAERIAEDAM